MAQGCRSLCPLRLQRWQGEETKDDDIESTKRDEWVDSDFEQLCAGRHGRGQVSTVFHRLFHLMDLAYERLDMRYTARSHGNAGLICVN